MLVWLWGQICLFINDFGHQQVLGERWFYTTLPKSDQVFSLYSLILFVFCAMIKTWGIRTQTNLRTTLLRTLGCGFLSKDYNY